MHLSTILNRSLSWFRCDWITCMTVIIIVIFVIILFQEDNIFGTNVSLTFDSQIQDLHAFDNYKKRKMKIIYSVYRADEVSVYRSCRKRATQPYSLGGGGTIYPCSRPAQDSNKALWERKISHLMTKPTKWHVRPALSAWRNLEPLATHWALSEDSD